MRVVYLPLLNPPPSQCRQQVGTSTRRMVCTSTYSLDQVILTVRREIARLVNQLEASITVYLTNAAIANPLTSTFADFTQCLLYLTLHNLMLLSCWDPMIFSTAAITKPGSETSSRSLRHASPIRKHRITVAAKNITFWWLWSRQILVNAVEVVVFPSFIYPDTPNRRIRQIVRAKYFRFFPFCFTRFLILIENIPGLGAFSICFLYRASPLLPYFS